MAAPSLGRGGPIKTMAASPALRDPPGRETPFPDSSAPPGQPLPSLWRITRYFWPHLGQHRRRTHHEKENSLHHLLFSPLRPNRAKITTTGPWHSSSCSSS